MDDDFVKQGVMSFFHAICKANHMDDDFVKQGVTQSHDFVAWLWSFHLFTCISDIYIVVAVGCLLLLP